MDRFYARLSEFKGDETAKMEINKPQDLERRRFRRLKANIFIIGNLGSGSDELKVVTKNISGGGLMFETEKDISQDTTLDLEIYQPIDCRKSTIFSIPVLARVVWIREIEKNNFEDGENKYRVGIEFSEIKEEDRQKIIKYVEENKS